MDLNPLDEIFNGTPELEEDKRKELLAEEELRTQQTLQSEQLAEEESAELPQQPQSASTGATKKETEEGPNVLETAAGLALAVPTGVVDFGVDALNKISPGGRVKTFMTNEEGNLKKIPEFESEVAQAVREISSVVVPTIWAAAKFKKLGKAAHGKLGWSLGNDAAFKWFANAGIGVGTGIAVDETAAVQEKDHNLMGTLKSSWPRTWGWIPDDWATLDSDSPDVKRQKNRNEGAGIGIGSDVLVGFGKLFKSLRGVKKATQWVPENEKAKNVLKKMKEQEKLAKDPVENEILNSVKRRSDQLDELGATNTLKSVNLDQPITKDTSKSVELSQSKAVDLRLFKEGINDIYSDGPVFVERIPEEIDLPLSINIKGVEDLGEIELKEFGLTKKEFSNLSPLKKVNLLKDSFEKTRKVLPPGKYELFGTTEKKRAIYAKWFKNDTDVEWFDIDTNQPAKPGKDSYAVLTVKDQPPTKPIQEASEPIFGVHDIYDYSESGLRTSDQMGIIGASVDQVRIEKNLETVYGRVGSVFTDSAIQFGLEADDAGLKLITDQADILKDSKYGYELSNGRYISHAEVMDTGERLAADLYRMDVDEMKRTLDNFSGTDVDTGAKVLTSEGYAGVFKAIRGYMDEFINMDIARAQAYIGTSFAGQVSDMAEGARLMDGTPAVKRAQEQVLDRLQYLMQIKGQTSYARGRALNMLNLWNRVNKKTVTKKMAMDAIKNEKNETLKALLRIQQESQMTIDTLRAVKLERPQLLGPLMLAYEVTDGKVSTITALNEYVRNSTGVFKKAFFDGKVDMPSAWTQGMWANIYNSVLSSVGTPLKAGLSNLALMIERPIATSAGALLHGDFDTLRRAQYMYTIGMGDTLQKAFSHMNQVFRRASSDPSSVGYIMRDDIARKNSDQMTLLRSFADAKEVEGLYGPSAIVNQIEAMNDLAEHPLLRFSANAMTAFDGFTRAFIGNIEARGRAFDTLVGTGKQVEANDLKKISDGVYDEMFDNNGFITDKAVEYASREIAMNLDNKAVDSLSQLIRRAPALKPFLMFPKTSMNLLAFSGSHNPLGVIINDLNAFKQPFEQMDQLKVQELLSSRGIPIDENMEAAYSTIRAELKGRKAIGTLSVLGAGWLFTSDRLRGNGIYDKERQKVRQEHGWKPRTYKGWDGKWYSYENLGALSDWLAFTADVMDNFDTLDEPSLELTLNKAGHLLSANLTNKSFTAGLEPLNDVLAGNPAALARWGASFGSSFVPGSGIRNEFSRLFTPQLKEVEQDFFQLLANRNPIVKESLPDLYDWMDGTKVGEPTSFFTRVWNTYSPLWKVSEGLTPEKQFLIDVEFDSRPSLRTNGRGVEYTPAQRSQVTQLIGKDGYFRDKVRHIMYHTATGKQFRKAYKEAARKGIKLNRQDFLNLHHELNLALRDSQRWAESRIDEAEEVANKQFINAEIERSSRLGDIDRVLQLQNR